MVIILASMIFHVHLSANRRKGIVIEGFTYLRPASVEEAVDMLNIHEDARILAGGTDLLVGLRDGASCKYIVDIKGIPKLNILETTEEGLAVGGAVSLNKLLDSDLVSGCYLVLKDAGEALANHLLRNRATLIGNLCNASPGGDMIGASLVLDGYIEAVSYEGTRNIPLSEFFTGVKKHTLRKNELAVRVVFPHGKGRGVYLKKKRIRGHDLAQVSLTAFRHDDGRLDVALGAVAPTPILIKTVVEAGETARVDKVIETVLGSINPISDVRSSREYRLAMVKHFICQSIGLLYGKEAAAE